MRKDILAQLAAKIKKSQVWLFYKKNFLVFLIFAKIFAKYIFLASSVPQTVLRDKNQCLSPQNEVSSQNENRNGKSNEKKNSFFSFRLFLIKIKPRFIWGELRKKIDWRKYKTPPPQKIIFFIGLFILGCEKIFLASFVPQTLF